MKKIGTFIMSLIIMVTLSFGISVKAAEAEVKISVNGKVPAIGESIKLKAEESIEILVDVNNMTKLFTAIVDFNYDKDLLQLESIKPNKELVGRNKFQLQSNGIDGTKARYGFSFLNPSIGYDGSDNFVTIKGKVLKDGEIKVSADNFKVQLVQRKDNGDMEYIKYSQTGVGEEVNGEDVKIDNIYEEIKNDGTDDRVVIDEEIKSNDDILTNGGGTEENKKPEDGQAQTTTSGDENRESAKDTKSAEDAKKTEDKSSVGIYIGLLIVAAVIATGTVLYRKKKNSLAETDIDNANEKQEDNSSNDNE
ncbi:cohesin domain-containing protein [Clostridium sp. LP20]|uniref:cohesin domain-containing protein n=1 Tax=Clostridium sp. LP20 TaxID=3418665 RepID=UPI003EE4576E